MSCSKEPSKSIVLKHDLENVFFSNMREYLKELKTPLETLSSKMEKLYELGGVSFEDYKKREKVRAVVQDTLRVYYPHCHVYIYGSSTNGFGEKACDIDFLFVPCPGYFTSEIDHSVTVPPRLEQVAVGDILKTELLKMGEKSQLLFALQVLQFNSLRFSKVRYIPAKFPILNFEFNVDNYKFTCDLSCRDILSIHNTELLYFFGRIDSRVKPLVFTILCWAKLLKHIHYTNFSNYAFTLLVIFFLQNTEPPVLPSVDYIMDASGSLVVGGKWEVCAFYDTSVVPKSENTSTTGDLLKQFFEFCWNFDFDRNLVCVRTGNVMPILRDTSDENFKKCEVSLISIQDPFKLSHNVSERVKNIISMKSFKLHSYIAFRMVEDNPNCSFDVLFDECEYKHVQNFKKWFPFSSEQSVLIVVDLNAIIDLKEISSSESSWCNRIFESVLKIFHRDLLFYCQVVDRIENPLNNRTELDKYLNSTSNKTLNVKYPGMSVDLLLSVQCAVYSWVWLKQYFLNPKKLSDGEKEEQILKEIAQNFTQSDDTPIFWFMCHCYKVSQLPCLTFELIPLTQSNEFLQMGKFLKNFLPKTLKKMLCRELTL